MHAAKRSAWTLERDLDMRVTHLVVTTAVAIPDRQQVAKLVRRDLNALDVAV